MARTQWFNKATYLKPIYRQREIKATLALVYFRHETLAMTPQEVDIFINSGLNVIDLTLTTAPQ